MTLASVLAVKTADFYFHQQRYVWHVPIERWSDLRQRTEMDPQWFVPSCFILRSLTSHIWNVTADPLFYLHHGVCCATSAI